MISRRDLLASGVGARLIGPDDSTGALARSDDSHYFSSMLSELREIRQAVSIDGAQAITLIRGAQRTYLKNSGRFPEFVDVGYDVFQSVIDWLVAVRQPVTINRLADGRYTVALFASTIVLRPDFPDNYVGQGYDK